jgi:hypothetical protein
MSRGIDSGHSVLRGIAGNARSRGDGTGETFRAARLTGAGLVRVVELIVTVPA